LLLLYLLSLTLYFNLFYHILYFIGNNDLFPPIPDMSNVFHSISTGSLGSNATSSSQITQVINGKQTTVKTTTQNVSIYFIFFNSTISFKK